MPREDSARCRQGTAVITFPFQAVACADQQGRGFLFLADYIIVSGGNALEMVVCNHGNLGRKAALSEELPSD